MTRAAMLTSTPSQSEPMRCGRPVWTPTRIRGVYPSISTAFTASTSRDGGAHRGPGFGEHRHDAVAHPLDDVPAGREQRRLHHLRNAPQQLQRRSSPARSDHSEKPTRSVKTSVTSRFAGLPDTRSVSACHTCSPRGSPHVTRRRAPAPIGGPGSGARTTNTGRGQRISESGSPGSARRARRRKAMTAGL